MSLLELQALRYYSLHNKGVEIGLTHLDNHGSKSLIGNLHVTTVRLFVHRSSNLSFRSAGSIDTKYQDSLAALQKSRRGDFSIAADDIQARLVHCRVPPISMRLLERIATQSLVQSLCERTSFHCKMRSAASLHNTRASDSLFT
jgi:hypothetical protein